MNTAEWVVGDTLLNAALLAPSSAALEVEGAVRTFAELAEASLRFAGALRALGLERGGRVVIQTTNSWDAVVAIYGTTLADGVFVVVNPQTRSDKLAYMLRDSEAQFLVVRSTLLGAHRAIEGDLPDLDHVLVAAADGDLPDGCSSLDEVLAGADPAEGRRAIPVDLAALIYTSGSTGNPKGVMMRHQNMVFTMQSLCRYLRLSSDDRIINFLPLAFDYGLYQLLMAVRQRATLILEQSFTFPIEVANRIDASEATVFPGVPTAYSMLRAVMNERTGLELPSVRRVTNTAAALPPAILGDLRRLFPNALIFAMYGLTECKRVSYLEPELLDERPSSVGKAIPGTEATVLVDGRPARPGEVGILHVRGPHVMAGYLNQPEQTAQMLLDGPVPGERMLCTQDHFTVDEDGFLYFVGRTDDIIKSGGQKVSPLEVENALHSIPGVRDAVVVAIPDDLLGEAIHAYVVRYAGSELNEREVISRSRQLLEPLLVPKSVEFVEDLPTTDSGKVRRKDLARR